MCQPWLGDTVLQHYRLVLVMEAILFQELGGLPQSQGGTMHIRQLSANVLQLARSPSSFVGASM